MSLAWRVLAVFPALAAPFGALAAEPAPAFQPSPVSFWSLLQVLFALALVLGAVAGAAWLLRRFSPGQNLVAGTLRVVGGVAVGPKERVVLVDVGDVWLVVGVAPGQVNALHTLPKQTHNVADDVPTGEQKNFAAWLKQAVQARRP
jgi:flagellar protein FliO/FliZ